MLCPEVSGLSVSMVTNTGGRLTMVSVGAAMTVCVIVVYDPQFDTKQANVRKWRPTLVMERRGSGCPAKGELPHVPQEFGNRGD